MINQPLVIGSTYRLKFKSTFERHGVCTTPGVTCLHPGGGVFRLEQITNFRDLVLSGVKLYDVFFKPLGIPEEQYQTYFDGKPSDEFTPEYKTQTVDNEIIEQTTKTEDGKLVLVNKHVITKHEVQVETGRSILKRHFFDNVDYASYPIYKFVDVIDTNDIIYVPELTIDTFPEIDIREYRDLSLVVHLGYLHDPASLDPMLLSIRERMAAYGWRPKNVKLYATDSKWMSPAEYDRIKELRIPAQIVTITPETKDLMVGEIAIINGSLKKIVDGVQDPVSEVDVNAIMKHRQDIDNRLFLVQCADGEVFTTGDNFYTQVTRNGIHCKKLLKEGRDYNPGDPCVTYELSTDDTPTDWLDYRKDPGQYTKVAYGHHGDYADDRLLRRLDQETYWLTEDKTRDRTKQYYILVSGTTYRPTEDDDFTEEGEFKEGVEYYEGTFNTMYRAATEEEIADPQQVLYVKEPDQYVQVQNRIVGETYVRVFTDKDGQMFTKVWKENYATVQALSLMGFKFDFDDNFGQAKTITLQLEDLIDLAGHELNVVLPDASFDYNTFWKKYEGRKFRWTEASEDPNNPTLTSSIEVKISEETKDLLSNKAGVLLGHSGQVSKETYVKDSGQQKRNYYMQYMIQSKELEDQKSKITALEQALFELKKSNDQLTAENEALTKRVEELTTT